MTVHSVYDSQRRVNSKLGIMITH
ncbi:protein of unknown function [Magnetospirillum sp. XM-1]|nr:protein of unknown function [Magnetospirillum sp. XM-1]